MSNIEGRNLDPNWEDSDWENDSEKEEMCPYTDAMMSAILCGKPFGMLWPDDTIEPFLRQRGYKILIRKNEETGQDYKVCVKPGELAIQDSGYSNLKTTFNKEVQQILLNWLLKIG